MRRGLSRTATTAGHQQSFGDSTYPVLPAPVGQYRVLPPCEHDGRDSMKLECHPRPADLMCPTTTTTLPPPGQCRDVADCASFPPECQHCENGYCEGLPVIQ